MYSRHVAIIGSDYYWFSSLDKEIMVMNCILSVYGPRATSNLPFQELYTRALDGSGT